MVPTARRTQPEFAFVRLARPKQTKLPRVRDPHWGKIVQEAFDEHVAAGKIKPITVEEKPLPPLLANRGNGELVKVSDKTGRRPWVMGLLPHQNGMALRTPSGIDKTDRSGT